MTFKLFMRAVDQELANRCGLSHLDLPDQCYSDYFEDEMKPSEVALMVLEDEGFPMTDEDNQTLYEIGL